MWRRAHSLTKPLWRPRAGALYHQMARAEVPTLRCAMLRVLLATKRTAPRAKLVQQPGFLPVLQAWLEDGEADHQATILVLLLQVPGEGGVGATVVVVMIVVVAVIGDYFGGGGGGGVGWWRPAGWTGWGSG